MVMLIHKDSHLDHGISPEQLTYLLAQLDDRTAFFCAEIELPAELGTVPCGLYGPTMGDAPVDERFVRYLSRGERSWTSRTVDWPMRETRVVTVIGGPHEDHPCVLFTAYGGPAAPREVHDPRNPTPEASAVFWNEHALHHPG